MIVLQFIKMIMLCLLHHRHTRSSCIIVARFCLDKTHFKKGKEEELGAVCGWVKEDSVNWPLFKVSLR